MSLWLGSPVEEEELRLLSRRDRTKNARKKRGATWVMLFADGLLVGCASLYWMVHGRFFDPGFYEAISGGALASAASVSQSVELLTAAGIRLAGFLGLVASVYVSAVAATSFRRGEQWSWYVMWMLPLLATLDFSLLAGYGALTLFAVTWDVGVLALSLLPLIASAGAFFPGAEQRPPPERG